MVSQSKQDYLARIKDRYRKAGKKAKSRILDEFCKVCGHHRKHAIRLLKSDGRRKKKKPGRPSKYGAEEVRVLENIWLTADRPCSKRMVGVVGLWLPHYEKHNGYLDAVTKEKLLAISPRTLDRLLGPARRKHGSRGLSGTRHGEYLKSNIPIKTQHGEITEPGHMQADTVAHCGGSMDGNFVWSLTLTDVLTGWTENGAVWNKGQYEVHRLLERMEERLPFRLKGFHSDNGGEFINHHLHSYYRDREVPIDMTRSRVGRSNDNPHVEQKNYTHVRLLLGWSRIENPEIINEINLLYEAANLLQNYFCASMHLVSKERRGARYHRKHDDATTPCQRLLESGHLNELEKTHLLEVSINLDPYNLRKLIDAKQKKIFKSLR
jgi:transposase InsO family protein